MYSYETSQKPQRSHKREIKCSFKKTVSTSDSRTGFVFDLHNQKAETQFSIFADVPSRNYLQYSHNSYSQNQSISNEPDIWG